MQLLSLLDHEKEDEKVREKTILLRKLHETAMKGSVTSLLQILHEDPLILSSTPPPSQPISDSPLHVVALLGHLHFTRELLNRNPDLAGALNSGGATPLHAASAKGYVGIVKELMSVNPDACFVLDHDGMSPLHLAAIKGRVGVLTELVRVKPEGALVLTRGGETCLHLCVKHSRLEALKLLVQSLKNDGFLNWKDGDGNTILHLAVAKKHLEIIKYLLFTTAIEVDTRNMKGLTALDVLSQSPRDLRDMEIKECLQGSGVVTTLNNTELSNIGNPDIAQVPSIITKHKNKKIEKPEKHKHTDWLGRKRSALMVVASLIATVAFQAAISPPGSVWQDDAPADSQGNPGHEAGKSVMAYNIPIAYEQFMIFDTIAFLASLSIILIQISGLPIKRRRWMWSQMITMWIAITAHTVTYFITFIHMSPKNVESTLFETTKIAVLTWLVMMAIVFIGNAVRVIRWLLIKYGYVKEKEAPSNGEDEVNDNP
ncbi:hypothetical protein U1Q18_002967 [Sarracenia purpurea var. burkii]